MAITYVKKKYGQTDLKFPVLHRVVYDHRLHTKIPARYERSYKDVLVDTWLKDNCRHPYYHSPGHLHEKFIEFEDDEEAVLFALRWS